MTSEQVGKDLPSELFLAGITNGCFPLVAVPGSGSIHVIANDGDADVADSNIKLGRLAFVRVKNSRFDIEKCHLHEAILESTTRCAPYSS